MSLEDRRFVTAKEAIRFQSPWTLEEWLCRADIVPNQELLMVRANMDAGRCHPFHTHPTREEIIFIVSGKAEQWCGKEHRILHPGERLTFDDAGLVRQDRPNLAKLTAWQNGQALFDNDTMAAAAAELNRYSRRPLVIEDPQVSRMRVSGVFRAGATQDFAVSISALLPVKAWVEQDRIVLRGDRCRAAQRPGSSTR